MNKSKAMIIFLVTLLLSTLIFNQITMSNKNKEVSKCQIELEKAKNDIEVLSNDLSVHETEMSVLKNSNAELENELNKWKSSMAKLRMEHEANRLEQSVDELLTSEWITYMLPPKIEGKWEAIDLISKETEFNPSSSYNDEMAIHSIAFKEESVEINSKDKILTISKWIDDVIYDKETVNEFKIKTFDGIDYLILEWKDSGYLSKGKSYGYYVFKRDDK